jgi:hypothetical protein
MRKVLFYLGLSISSFVSLITIGCGEEGTTPPTETAATVSTRTTLYYPKVISRTPAPLVTQAPSIGQTCDSIFVNRARVLFSNLKMHRDQFDSTGSGTLTAGSFVATFNYGQTLIASFASLPSGIYDRIKFEVHKYNASIDTILDPTNNITDFITSERNTAIIEGIVYTGGIGYPFVYKSRVTLNTQAQFPDPRVIEIGQSYTVFIDFFPEGEFATNDGAVLDPRDSANSRQLDASLKNAFRSWTATP